MADEHGKSESSGTRTTGRQSVERPSRSHARPRVLLVVLACLLVGIAVLRLSGDRVPTLFASGDWQDGMKILRAPLDGVKVAPYQILAAPAGIPTRQDLFTALDKIVNDTYDERKTKADKGGRIWFVSPSVIIVLRPCAQCRRSDHRESNASGDN